MTFRTETQLTPRQRLARGLAYSAVGPVDVTRGAVRIGVDSAQAGVADLMRRYRNNQLAKQLRTELAAAQYVVSGLPQALAHARTPKSNRRPWLLAGAGVIALAAGGIAFAMIRRSSKPPPSARPPSVEIDQKP